ncbi:MAG: alanine--glyoxylate aminotransferase family protein [Alteromonadaceae bacterium TMED101]|nr:MAG: alanine--glyoxylate aminotransferase family protein [Alteromonadaceae bacterium TMED101]
MSAKQSTSSTFYPPVRTLMGPGPSDVSPRVLAASARPTIGHLDPLFVGLMDDVKRQLQYAFQTHNELTIPLSAPGSAGMEAAFVNLVECGDKVIVCQNGVFGGRMKENVERCGATPIMVIDSWGDPVDPEKLEAAIKAHPDAKVVAFVHAETSTGVRSDAQTLCHLAKSAGMLVIMDAVTSLAGIELKADDWGADVVYSGTQKCLSGLPGISPITFSNDAVAAIKVRKHKVQSWFLDMNLIMGYWGEGAKRSYHHTAPVNAVYALHEALLMLEEEGLEASFARHKANHLSLANGLSQLGLELAVAEAWRLPQLNSVLIPEGVDDAQVRSRLLNEFDLEVGAGLGELAGKQWRIGLMGTSSSAVNINRCLTAFETVLA